MAWTTKCSFFGITLLLLLGYSLVFAVSNDTRSPTNGKVMACYYVASSYFPVSKVPAHMCTHIIFSSAAITPRGIQPGRPGDVDIWKALVSLKTQNPSLKVMLSLGGGFPSVVDTGSETEMTKWANTASSYLEAFGIDGMDLDWESPKFLEKHFFKMFIEILSSSLKKKNMLLSAALPNNDFVFMMGFDAQTLASHMDFMTAMTYDFHVYNDRGDFITGYNSPLFTPPGEVTTLSTAALLSWYKSVGIPLSKLLMGLPLYGRSWTLADPSKHDLHSPAVGIGPPSPYFRTKGVYIYPDVCVALQRGATRVLDKANGGAYLYNGTTWVAFDDVDTVDMKMSYMKKMGYGGVGIWAMDLDDLPGVCDAGPLPLLKAIHSRL